MLYGWNENSILTNCLAACAHLTITVSEIERDNYEKIVILSYPLHSTPPLGGFPSEYRHPLWYGKTRMVSLPDGEKISKICLFILTWSTNVTDGQTLRDSKDRAYASHRAVKKLMNLNESFRQYSCWEYVHLKIVCLLVKLSLPVNVSKTAVAPKRFYLSECKHFIDWL